MNNTIRSLAVAMGAEKQKISNIYDQISEILSVVERKKTRRKSEKKTSALHF